MNVTEANAVNRLLSWLDPDLIGVIQDADAIVAAGVLAERAGNALQLRGLPGPAIVGRVLGDRLATGRTGVLAEVVAERRRQDAKWGEQNHPDIDPGIANSTYPAMLAAEHYELPTAERARLHCQRAAARGDCTWTDVLLEEVAEAVEAAATDPAALRAELIQVAAVAMQWVQAIDRRPAGRSCRACGCTDDRACEGGCSWAAADLCSQCVPDGGPTGGH